MDDATRKRLEKQAQAWLSQYERDYDTVLDLPTLTDLLVSVAEERDAKWERVFRNEVDGEIVHEVLKRMGKLSDGPDAA